MTYKLIDPFCGAASMTLEFEDPPFSGRFERVLAVDRPAGRQRRAPDLAKTVARIVKDTLKNAPARWIRSERKARGGAVGETVTT